MATAMFFGLLASSKTEGKAPEERRKRAKRIKIEV